MNKSEEQASRPPGYLRWILTETSSLWLMIIGLSIIVIGVFIFLNGDYSSIDPSAEVKSDKVGQFGDFIGGLAGSLWALAGVILFYIALTKQKEALELQKEEFELQRDELVKTREVFEKQNQTQEFLQYETSFYKLIELHQKVIDRFTYSETITYTKSTSTGFARRRDTTIERERVVHSGMEAIKQIEEEVRSFDVEKEGEKEVAFEWFSKYRVHFIPYFNLLTEILVKINRCPVVYEKSHFRDILTALLSQEELSTISVFKDHPDIDRRFQKLFDSLINQDTK